MTSTTGWHADPALLAAYLDGWLDAVLGSSLERHLDHCADCRARVRPLVDPSLLAEAWSGVRMAAEIPPRPWLVRHAQRLGLPEPTGILLAATTSLRSAWLTSAFLALSFATFGTMAGDGTMLWPFLLVAPLVPVLGVAAAYGTANEAFEALAVASPYGRTRLVLLRTVAVLVTTLPVAGVVGLFLPGPSWVAAAWLGPALAMVPVMMAIASFVGPRAAAPVVVLLWSGLVLGSVRQLPSTWPVELSQQLGYLVLAAMAVAVLAVRAHRSRRMGVVL